MRKIDSGDVGVGCLLAAQFLGVPAYWANPSIFPVLTGVCLCASLIAWRRDKWEVSQGFFFLMGASLLLNAFLYPSAGAGAALVALAAASFCAMLYQREERK